MIVVPEDTGNPSIDYNDIQLNDYSKHKISVAPMLDFTTPHFRFLMRLITKHSVLWTEMINCNTILLSSKGYERELFFSEVEHPLVLQLGGSDPMLLSEASIFAKAVGYSEINLNCGCPSSKVSDSNFGACLMRQPSLVYDCCKSIKDATNLEVSIKCRLGLDLFEKQFLYDFISTNSKLIDSNLRVVNHFIMHARVAIMGIDTIKNRKIPPLLYDKVIELKESFPDLSFTLNGGIKTKDEAFNLLSKNEGKINGIMIGRAAYDNPFLFADFDSTFYNKKDQSLTRAEILYKYADYCDEMTNKFDLNKHQLIHPLCNIFNGERYNTSFKELLFAHRSKDVKEMGDHIREVIQKFEKVNPKACERLTIYK